MHKCSIFLLIAFNAFGAYAQILVPDSTSPDRKAALYFRHLPSTSTNGEYQFYFRDPKSLSSLSSQLVPVVRGKILGAKAAVDYDYDTGLLFEDIGADTDAKLHKEQRNGAFRYFVTWSPDSRWVSIEGGQHKFWHLMIYHLEHGRFERIKLPVDRSFIDYFETHWPRLKVKSLGASKKILPHDYGSPGVCWLRNGIVAIDTYPYLFRQEDYSGVNAPFYYVDCRTKPKAMILGFCR